MSELIPSPQHVRWLNVQIDNCTRIREKGMNKTGKQLGHMLQNFMCSKIVKISKRIMVLPMNWLNQLRSLSRLFYQSDRISERDEELDHFDNTVWLGVTTYEVNISLFPCWPHFLRELDLTINAFHSGWVLNSPKFSSKAHDSFKSWTFSEILHREPCVQCPLSDIFNALFASINQIWMSQKIWNLLCTVDFFHFYF